MVINQPNYNKINFFYVVINMNIVCLFTTSLFLPLSIIIKLFTLFSINNELVWKAIYYRNFRNNKFIKKYYDTLIFHHILTCLKNTFKTPRTIYDINQIAEIKLSNYYKTGFHLNKFAYLNNLKSLKFNGMSLFILPFELNTNLIELLLFASQLYSVAIECCHLINLQILDLGNNHLVAVPHEINKLKYLKRLYLDMNRLYMLPSELCQLSNLKLLWLNNNLLLMLPTEIGNLNKLRNFSICYNNFTTLNELDNLLHVKKILIDTINWNLMSEKIKLCSTMEIINVK